jgi:hypothetical protein
MVGIFQIGWKPGASGAIGWLALESAQPTLMDSWATVLSLMNAKAVAAHSVFRSQ